ncbi:hypothetical protein HYPSUDRAFT_51202 [Hypholoma sublateritium FD-334 SS-4]|uniref:Fungal-type protein kinase domain-containing protein n=1 Tax=Hypholoma sublateritium (strain FD-334 SS-4) TaxID=945553 RepID=A0A0D2PBX7_HYPSF|nr:hypothetical protein HYPSUDRAFT_51202 [Hypholoma sublateritium FD-334 SS-4]
MFSSPHQSHVASGNTYRPMPHPRRLSCSQPSRSLREFNRPEEVLRAVRDAIAAHKQAYMSTGLIHGSVNIDTIRIGAPSYAPHMQGYLVPSLPNANDATFKSEAMLFGTGILFNKYPVSPFWGGEDMEEFLDNMHYILGSRYRQKLELGRPRSVDELRSDAIQDYDAFINIFNEALYKSERRG